MKYAVIDVETVGIDSAREFVEPSSAPSNYKDELKIAAYIKKADEDKILDAGLDPDLARIVCIGWRFSDNPHVQAISCRSEEAEANTLAYFWGQVRGANLITFNGRRFDLPVLMRRSLYLGIKAPSLSMDRYRSPHIDLMQRLSYDGAITAHSLKFYAKRLGLEHDDEIIGKDIAALVQAARDPEISKSAADACWHRLEMHCISDVNLTFQIAERMGVIDAVVQEQITEGAA